jgi:large subunit ribosomal protein L25
MAIPSIPLTAQTRTTAGSSASGRLRRQGTLPGVIYGANKARSLQLNTREIDRILAKATSEYLMFDLAIDGAAPVKALLKDVQHNPLTSTLVHVDFQEVQADKRIRYNLAIEPVGTPVGVASDGGTLETLIRSISVECLPGDMTERVSIDVSAMKIGDHLTVGELPVDKSKFKIVTAGNINVFSLVAPKTEEEVAATPAEGAAAGEPEVLKEKKPEEGAEAAPAGKDGAKAAAPAKDAKPEAKKK